MSNTKEKKCQTNACKTVHLCTKIDGNCDFFEEWLFSNYMCIFSEPEDPMSPRFQTCTNPAAIEAENMENVENG
jgi:hypothetical protein